MALAAVRDRTDGPDEDAGLAFIAESMLAVQSLLKVWTTKPKGKR